MRPYTIVFCNYVKYFSVCYLRISSDQCTELQRENHFENAILHKDHVRKVLHQSLLAKHVLHKEHYLKRTHHSK